jgi:hypothetical protein
MIYVIMKQILLLSGYAGSGKDAAASLLMEECGFQRFAFADALKDLVADCTGIPVTIFHSSQKDTVIPPSSKYHPKTYRDLLLEVAREERAKDLDVFSRIVAGQIQESDGLRNRFVISDWRYKREESFLRSVLDPATYQIVRVRIKRSSVTPSADPTEHDLDDEHMDTVIQNDGSISDLRDQVHSAFRRSQPGSYISS